MSGSHRILVVEDEPNVRLVLRTALASNACLIATATDGEMLASAKRALRHRLFHRAGALLREAIKENPNAAEPRDLLGVLHEVEGKPRAASEAYCDALRVDPDYEPASLHLMTLRDSR